MLVGIKMSWWRRKTIRWRSASAMCCSRFGTDTQPIYVQRQGEVVGCVVLSFGSQCHVPHTTVQQSEHHGDIHCPGFQVRTIALRDLPSNLKTCPGGLTGLKGPDADNPTLRPLTPAGLLKPGARANCDLTNNEVIVRKEFSCFDIQLSRYET